jgi:hypothetical protein
MGKYPRKEQIIEDFHHWGLKEKKQAELSSILAWTWSSLVLVSPVIRGQP